MDTTALLHLIAVLTVGIATGVALRTYGRRSADSPIVAGSGLATYALIGIAGAFTGFQIAVALALPPVDPLSCCRRGALITLVLWRGP
jgi:hypothetical protein